MKIAIDARFFGPAGTGLGTYTRNLIENLERFSSSVSSGQANNQYFVLLQKENFNLYKPKAKNFIKVLADVSWYSLTEQIKIPQILREIQPDLVHFCHFNVPIFYSGKFVVTIHDLIKHEFGSMASTTRTPLIYWTKHAAYKIVISQAIRKSAKILVPSKWVKKRILKEFQVPSEKIIVTYEAAEEEFLRGKENESEREEVLRKYKVKSPYLIYVGNLYPYKNLESVLKALKILDKKSSPAGGLKFLIASARDIFYQRFQDLVKKYQLENKVVMPGFIPTDDLVILFSQASAYVFPSFSEGFGIPGLNAAAAGLPLIASDIPVFHEVYDDTAVFFDPKNPNDLAQKIRIVLTNEELRQDLISKEKEQVKKYSWQEMVKETLEAYRQAVATSN